MSDTRFSNRPVDRKLCSECKKILKNNDITSLKEFRKWALKNHPDKGGDEETFGIVSGCNDEYFGTNKRCDMDMNYSGYGYKREKPKKSRKSPREKPKKSKKPPAPKEPKPCNSDQIRNPKTGRCVLKRSPLGKKIMKEMGGSSRRASSRRASSRRASSRRASSRRASSRRASSRRASSAKKGRKACNSDQIRNPKTGRCVLKRSPLGKKIMKEKKGSRRASSRRASSRRASSRRASSRRASSVKKGKKPCNSDQIRNPKTGRCVLKRTPLGKKIMKEKKGSSRRSSRRA